MSFSQKRQGTLYRVQYPIEGITANYIADDDDDPWGWEKLYEGEILLDTGLRLDGSYNDHVCFTSKGFFLIESDDIKQLEQIQDPVPKK